MEFLKRRKNNPVTPPSSATPINNTAADDDVSDARQPLSGGGGWVNMDRVERDKMEWMTDVPIAKDTIPQVRIPYLR